MATKKTDKLPEGVGKRIIENLKSQDYQSEYEETDNSDLSENPEYAEEEISRDSFDSDNEEENPESEFYENTQHSENNTDLSYTCSPEVKPKNTKKFKNPEYAQEKTSNASGASDIDTLLKLINQLPSGVTKQTGAFIIRQTMEAMGISMNKVLGDAQSVQEDLENNIKNNINVIEEYKTKVKILEQEIQNFRKKAHELEDIISLFILSDEKK